MKKLVIKEIVEAINGKLLYGDEKELIGRISRDSREVDEETLFFFLVGEKQDGHKFIKDVIDQGVKNLVVSNKNAINDIGGSFLKANGINVIYVEDTTKALQELSKYYLKKVSPKVIGITGSIGKTSTKDMTLAVCSEKFKTVATKGNYNNEIGLPLTIFTLEEDTEIAVLEMGMGERGEIKFLAQLAEPEIGIITNIGTSHIEKLGSVEEIYNEKMDITSFFNEKSTLIYHPDEKYLVDDKKDREYKNIFVKLNKGNFDDIVVSEIVELGEDGIEFTVSYMSEKEKVKLSLMGKHNAINGGFAISAGIALGMTLKEACRGIKNVEMTKGRLTIKEVNGFKVIDDSYNASPASMKAAIDIIEGLPKKGSKVAFLADMLEMGEFAEEYHYELGRYIGNKNIDVIVTIGDKAKFINKGICDFINENKQNNLQEVKNREFNIEEKKAMHYNSNSDVIIDLKKIVSKGDTLIFKGSRGMKLEEIIKAL